MSSDIFLQSVVLANGATVPLGAAIRAWGALEVRLGSADSEWNTVRLLREKAFGRELNDSQLWTLRDEGLLSPDGILDPVLQEVILAAVRGCGGNLWIDCPFTEDVHRSIANYRQAHQFLQAHIDDPETRRQALADPLGAFGPVLNDPELLRPHLEPPTAAEQAGHDQFLKKFTDQIRRKEPGEDPLPRP